MGFLVLDVVTLGGSSLVKGAIKTGFKVGSRAIARNALKKVGQSLPRGGKSFDQFKRAFWKGNNKPSLNPIINNQTGEIWKQYTELHHRFIAQRHQKAFDLPDWLVNNKWNLKPLNSLQHAQMDPYRARFAPQWVKKAFNLKWK